MKIRVVNFGSERFVTGYDGKQRWIPRSWLSLYVAPRVELFWMRSDIKLWYADAKKEFIEIFTAN